MALVWSWSRNKNITSARKIETTNRGPRWKWLGFPYKVTVETSKMMCSFSSCNEKNQAGSPNPSNMPNNSRHLSFWWSPNMKVMIFWTPSDQGLAVEFFKRSHLNIAWASNVWCPQSPHSFSRKITTTPPKTNMDTQNDGLEKVTPLQHGNFWYPC